MIVKLSESARSNHVGWLKAEKEYQVISISFDLSSGSLVRLVSENSDTPALFPIDDFEIIDAQIDNGWSMKKYSSSNFTISPTAWLRDSYWEEFFDGDEVAMKTFSDGLRSIYENKR